MNPRTLLRLAVLNALVAAAAQDPADPEFAPLATAQAWLDDTWPSQSPPPGGAVMPNQLLIYVWDDSSDTMSDSATAPQFTTALTLVVEARVETKGGPASGTIADPPSQSAVLNGIGGALDLLAYAVKKAVCQNLYATAQLLAIAAGLIPAGTAYLNAIRSVKTAAKLNGDGQRQLGNAGIAFTLVYTETFEPVIDTPLTTLSMLSGVAAAAQPDQGNQGNGTIGPVAVGLGVELGDYAVTFTTATAFAVTAPDSTPIGTGTVGQPFSAGGLAFLVTAGTVAFQAGDGFAIAVQAGAQTVLDLSTSS